MARNMSRNLRDTKVEEIMTRGPKTVAPQTLAMSAMAMLNDHNISALLVVEGQKAIGIIGFHDLLRIGVA